VRENISKSALAERTLPATSPGANAAGYRGELVRHLFARKPQQNGGTEDVLVLELAIILILIVVNGLLSMSELAIVSSRPARLGLLVQKRIRGAQRALELASDPGKFLSTVQIGITLVGVLSGAFSGATIGLRLTEWFMELGLSEYAADILGVGFIVTFITYATLIVGELVPKQVALRDPEAIAIKISPAMGILVKLLLPLVVVLDVSAKAVLTVLGRGGETVGKISEDEIHHVVREAESAGVLEPGEKEMIAGVMRLGDRPVGAVMTPRTNVDEVDLNDDSEKIREAIAKSRHSRLPVTDGDRDRPIGILQSKDLLSAYMREKSPDLRSLIREAPIIPASADARDVLMILKTAPVHVGLVYDEHGAFEGIVTATDILEAIVGAFYSEEGPPEPAYVRRPDGSFIISGWMPLDEFGDLLAAKIPRHRGYHTVAGLVLQHFGALPEVGDAFDFDGWRIEVIDLDGRRIDKLLATRKTGAEQTFET
jgi:magnesium and cobalt exporter, CNNM family